MIAPSIVTQLIEAEAKRVAALRPDWTARELAPYLSGVFSVHAVPFGPKRIVITPGHELLRTQLGWFGKPLTHEPLSTGRADYRDILVGDSE